MGTKSKSIAGFIILIIAISSLSLLIVNPATAQSIAKPTVPQFTVGFVDHSYNVPVTYTNSTNPYTGQQVITSQGGYHVENKTIEITINNQPFTPYTDAEGHVINLYYNVRAKGHFGQNWTEMFGVQRTVWGDFSKPIDNFGYMIQTYTSQYTIVEITNPPTQGQMDIQVKALEGYTNRTIIQGHIIMAEVAYTFYGEESDWSNTQTITIPETSTSTSPTPNPTPTPTVPEFPSWTISSLLSLMVTISGLLAYHKKHKRNLVKKV
jgi:hypothetical protein